MATRTIKTPGVSAPEQAEQPAQVVAEQSEPVNALPRASDIDPFTITKAVLTQDGWVCPA